MDDLFRQILGRGWYDIEQGPTGIHVWSQKNAEVQIPCGVSWIELHFYSNYCQLTKRPQHLSLYLDDRFVRTLTTCEQDNILQVTCADSLRLVLEVDTVRPCDHVQTADSRSLGVDLHQVRFDTPPKISEVPRHGEISFADTLQPTGLPVSLQLEVSTACNLRCTMCSSHARTPMGSPLQPKQMSAEVWGKVRDVARKAEAVTFLGSGEVFTNPKFLSYLEELDAFGVRTVFSTNGHIITPSSAKRLAALAHLHRINVSIDSPDPAIYARIRGRPLQAALRGLALLAEQPSLTDRICLVAVVMTSTLESLAAFPTILAASGITHFVLRGLFDYDFSLSEEVPEYNDRDREVLHRIKTDCRRLGIRTSFLPTIPDDLVEIADEELGTECPDDLVERFYGATPANGAGLTKQCYDPWEKAVICYDGKVHPCDVYGGGSEMGCLVNQSFEEIWTGKRFRQFRNDLLFGRLIYCRTCCRRRTGRHLLAEFAAKILFAECNLTGTEHVRVVVQNLGTVVWTRQISICVGTSDKKDREDSAYYHPSWIKRNRPCTCDEENVPPGAVATFRFSIAPALEAGPETFQLVIEGVHWLPNLHFRVCYRT